MPLFAETDLGTTVLVLLVLFVLFVVIGLCGRGAMKLWNRFDNDGSIHPAAKEGFKTTAKEGVQVFLGRCFKR